MYFALLNFFTEIFFHSRYGADGEVGFIKENAKSKKKTPSVNTPLLHLRYVFYKIILLYDDI